MITQKTYTIHEVAPYINWSYFYHAWQISVRSEESVVRSELRREAERMLQEFDGKYHTDSRYGLFDANSDGDDIFVECGVNGEERSVRIPMLRQQRPSRAGQPCMCLSDFIRPCSSGRYDRIGVFAATVDASMETDYKDDDFAALMAQTLADRLAEATVELLHEEVRKHVWGYAPDEHLTMEQLHREEFQGIRPAVGYPSLPDTSLNFLLSDLIDMRAIGISLTENGMMRPHASVSGLMISHPEARYFDLGRIGEDQLRDYADRRGLPVDTVRKFLAVSLMK